MSSSDDVQIDYLCRAGKCQREQLAELRTLDAGDYSRITDAGLAHVPNLTTLYAWGSSGITDVGLAHVPNLTTLNAGGNSGITDAAAQRVNR